MALQPLAGLGVALARMRGALAANGVFGVAGFPVLFYHVIQSRHLSHLSQSRTRPVIYIQDPQALQRCLHTLAQAPAISFDLEFDNNRYSYGVTLCLVQVATTEVCYIIDPMTGMDLSGLYALFQQEGIQKLVHSPGEDLRLLHSLGCYPTNLFDTEIVGRLLNYEQTSLANMLREKLDYTISKKHQKSNWLRRPLSEEQVEYAADDVIWLHPLKAALVAEAEAKGLMPYVREEQAHLSGIVYHQTEKTNFLKPADRATLSPLDQHLTNELLRFRDELARQINRPPFQVMGEDLVRALATGTHPPEQLLDEPGIHPRFKTYGFVHQLSAKLEAIRADAAGKNLSTGLPTRPKLSPEQYAAQRKAAQDRDELFLPIQQELAQRFGTFAAQYLLSNRLVNELLRDPADRQGILPAYRKALMRQIAMDLGLNHQGYFGVDV